MANYNKLYEQIVLVFISLLFLFSCRTIKEDDFTTNSRSSISELILGGGDKVIIIDYEGMRKGNKMVNWQLTTSNIVGLPDSLYRNLKSVDDHKLVDNNKKLIISSSSGAVVLIDRKSKDFLFYAVARNAHSVEYLPNNRIAVALSTGDGGNGIEIYDEKRSSTPLFRDSLYSGHGVIWNEKRKLLYAIVYNQLHAYSLKDWDSETPKLVLNSV